MSDRVVNLRALRARRSLMTLPADVIRVDRGTHWGNPYVIGRQHPDRPGEVITRRTSIELYRRYSIDRLISEPSWLDPLYGLRLACWCTPKACHADVLVALVDLVGAARHVMRPEALSGWLRSPVPLLEGLTPRDAIAAGHVDIVSALLVSLGAGTFV